MSRGVQQSQPTEGLHRRTNHRVKDLQTPAFVIDRFKFSRNCQQILDHAERNGFRVRPHIKTHKTVQGALLQATGMEQSEHDQPVKVSSLVTGFVASTLPEVELLIDAAKSYGGPFCDILYGVPVTQSKLERIHSLRETTGIPNLTVRILLDNEGQVDAVEQFAREQNVQRPFSVFVKLDTGYHRAGIACDNRGVKLVNRIATGSPFLQLAGVYSHW